MEVIHLHLDRKYPEITPLAITIGQFDGLHLAHIKIIKNVVSYAKERNIKSAVFTFDPHPDYFLGKREYNGYLTPNTFKMMKIEELGIDYLFLIPFNKTVSSMLPKEFIEKVLKKFSIRKIFVGFDFTFGYCGQGKVKDLKEYYSVDAEAEVFYNEEKMSSTIIREYLYSGKIEEVTRILGSYYMMQGTVISGNHIGTTLGIRTANINIIDDYPVLRKGVYAVYVTVDNVLKKGVANFGYHPTVKKTNKPILEVHILDFVSEIYNEKIKVELVSFLRDEKKFASLDDLKKQINIDIITAKGKLKR